MSHGSGPPRPPPVDSSCGASSLWTTSSTTRDSHGFRPSPRGLMRSRLSGSRTSRFPVVPMEVRDRGGRAGFRTGSRWHSMMTAPSSFSSTRVSHQRLRSVTGGECTTPSGKRSGSRASPSRSSLSSGPCGSSSGPIDGLSDGAGLPTVLPREKTAELRRELERTERAVIEGGDDALAPYGGFRGAVERLAELRQAAQPRAAPIPSIDAFDIWRSTRIPGGWS